MSVKIVCDFCGKDIDHSRYVKMCITKFPTRMSQLDKIWKIINRYGNAFDICDECLENIFSLKKIVKINSESQNIEILRKNIEK